jgi:hypothetical protein
MEIQTGSCSSIEQLEELVADKDMEEELRCRRDGGHHEIEERDGLQRCKEEIGYVEGEGREAFNQVIEREREVTRNRVRPGKHSGNTQRRDILCNHVAVVIRHDTTHRTSIAMDRPRLPTAFSIAFHCLELRSESIRVSLLPIVLVSRTDLKTVNETNDPSRQATAAMSQASQMLPTSTSPALVFIF